MTKLRSLSRQYKISMWPMPCQVMTLMMLWWQIYAYAYDGLPKLSWWIVFAPLYIVPATALAFVGMILFVIVMCFSLAGLSEGYKWFVGRKT